VRGCGCVRASYLSLADNAIRLLPNSIGSLRLLADLNVSHNEVHIYTRGTHLWTTVRLLHEETCARDGNVVAYDSEAENLYVDV
jgi:hypothetical protein